MARRLILFLLFAVPVGFHADALAKDKPTQAEAAAKQEERRETEEYYELFRMLAETLDEVERNYVEPVDRRELMEAAIEGVISKLDPHSRYISPQELRSFRDSVENKFGGIGIQVTLEGGELKVISPLVGTPAYRAGIRAGDRIIRVEGKPTKGMTLDQAVKTLRGKIGTSVKLTVLHADDSKTETLSIAREVVRVKTVLGDRRRADDSWEYFYDRERRIGFIRVTAFSRETAAELRQALLHLQEQGLKGLVLDLRFNPGGLLSAAIEISDLFIADGVIVSTEGRNTKERVWKAHKPGTFRGFPMVVLVNRYSASASEIVAGCLQDHGRAVVVGERTYGKGSVQNVIELEGGKSALKLTTASYQRPSGVNIHRFPGADESDDWGVRPDRGYEIKLTMPEIRDLMEYRRKKDLLLSGPPDRIEEGTPPEPVEALPANDIFADRQLHKAVDYLSDELARAK